MSGHLVIDPHNPPKRPDLSDLSRADMRRLQLEIRTNAVGTVISFNPTLNEALVRIDPIACRIDPRSGREVPFAPFQATIPVHHYGSGDADPDCYITVPILPGTTGSIHVFDRGIQNWLDRTDPTRGYDPEHRELHMLHDAEFCPGLNTRAFPIPVPVDLTALVINHSAGIKLGRTATLGVARLTDTTAADASMQAWITAVQLALSVISGAAGADPNPAIVTPTAPSDFGVIDSASTKVKAE